MQADSHETPGFYLAELFAKGKDEWNSWAKALLTSKSSEESWNSRAKIDFRNILFTKPYLDFSGYIFPGETIFSSIVFQNKVSFDSAVFHGSAFFEGSEFQQSATFNGTVFLSTAWFSDPTAKLGHLNSDTDFFCKFIKRASFNGAFFSQEAWFSGVQFGSDTQFINATFCDWTRFDDIACQSSIQFDKSVFFRSGGNSPNGSEGEGGAWFVGSKYSGQAWFRETRFEDVVSFQGAVFDNDAMFQDAIFCDEARFSGVLSKRVFSLGGAHFDVIPVFVQTHFDEAPDFDDVEIEDYVSKKSIRISKLARWRALRRLAIQSKNHEKEREYFSSELWALPRTTIRYWFGVAYWIFSCHGRSVVRPALWWCALSISCFFIYFLYPALQVRISPENVCSYQFSAEVSDNWGSIISDEKNICQIFFTSRTKEALNLTLKNSFVNLDASKNAEEKMYACLYGAEVVRVKDGLKTIIPQKPYLIQWVSALQKMLSALFLFLFGTAIRNILRVQ